MIIKNLPDPIINYYFKNVYPPSDDSYLIIDYFKKNINLNYFDGKKIQDIARILDIGTGSGVIAIFFLLLKEHITNFNPEVYASDILAESIECAKLNEKANKFENQINFIRANLFKSFPDNLRKKFDIIIFNPPYLPSSQIITESINKTKIDYSWDGGRKGIEVFMRFLHDVKDFIKEDSYIYYVSSSMSDLEQLNEFIIQLNEHILGLGFKNEVLKKKHVFFEDIFLNRIKVIKD